MTKLLFQCPEVIHGSHFFSILTLTFVCRYAVQCFYVSVILMHNTTVSNCPITTYCCKFLQHLAKGMKWTIWATLAHLQK